MHHTIWGWNDRDLDDDLFVDVDPINYEAWHSCKECNETFQHKSLLALHELSHSGEKSFKCSLCNMSFFLESRLRRHESTHSGVMPFVCDLCGKSLKTKRGLELHKSTHK